MDVTVVAGFLLLLAVVALLVVSVCHPVYFPVLVLGLCLAVQALRYPPVPPEVAQQVLRPNGRLSVVAHRGGGYDAPENTLGAIRKAAENNATGVELDLEFTSDGFPILMHDRTVDRTTDGIGSLDHLTFEDVRKLNPAAKHRLHKYFPNEKVPTLEEAIVESLKGNMTIYFDVKGHAAQASAALKKMYQEYPELYTKSIVCSFDPLVIFKMKQVDKNVATALTHRPWRLSFYGNGKPKFHDYRQYWYMLLDIILDWSLHAFLWKFFGISAFLMQKNFISMDYIRFWAERGVEVVAWTVNYSDEKRYYEKILHCIYITDSLIEKCSPAS
ncbi:glycerophosphodiester phosphodiesterase 1 isoform X1 [Rhincodon typus]|uniref:glycerophosphodiester phosphodiesterase 1 isoform X1 n=1 Tax=Rhincodon typus TaxID=259920 RepID=UPI0009A2B4B1|nr:glycerophosphodiester phosphodiesterase 1 isoform X1 [Rhincodon typus]